MENEILFSEKQSFKQWWLWLILLGFSGLALYSVFIQIIEGQPVGDKPMSNFGLIAAVALILVLPLFFAILRLETQISKDGISVRFFPFHLRFKRYAWSEISKSYVREYSPLGEYGGWGLRGIGKNKALNVSGNMGLQLEFTNEKKLLIGTKKPDELSEALTKIGLIKQ